MWLWIRTKINLAVAPAHRKGKIFLISGPAFFEPLPPTAATLFPTVKNINGGPTSNPCIVLKYAEMTQNWRLNVWACI
jgi:hypothetical protein